MSEAATDLLRGLHIALAGVIIGMSVQVFIVYVQKAHSTRGPAGQVPRHIAAISFSYIGLLVHAAITQFELLIGHRGPTWRLIALPLFYLAGAYALTQIIQAVSARQNTPRRRETDPAG